MCVLLYAVRGGQSVAIRLSNHLQFALLCVRVCVRVCEEREELFFSDERERLI